jgi:hypothetical protein
MVLEHVPGVHRPLGPAAGTHDGVQLVDEQQNPALDRLDLASVRAVLAAVDDERTGFHGVLEVLNRASYHHDAGVYGQADVASASHEVAQFIEAHGWSSVRSSAGEELTGILAALRGQGCESDADIFTPFAAAAKMVTTAELEMAEPGDEQAQKGLAVMRYVLFEAAFAAMRRLCGAAMAAATSR